MLDLTIDSPGLRELVDETVELRRLATGFTFTEGPVWVRSEGALHFSDMPENKRRRWHPADGVREVPDGGNRCNGMAVDGGGARLVCEGLSGHVVRESRDGDSEVIASHYDGRGLNGPNDIIAASDGSAIFTDPPWGRTSNKIGRIRDRELDFCGVFRIPPDRAELQLLVGDFNEPNGLCLSPDETLLYVNDSAEAHIRVFDVGPGYELSGGRVFAAGIRDADTPGVVDGMKADALGNIYVTGPGGIWVFAPDGARLGIVGVPEVPANLNWGDEDWRTLYITARTSIYRVRMSVAGNRVPGQTLS
jgi:gluconolactonase